MSKISIQTATFIAGAAILLGVFLVPEWLARDAEEAPVVDEAVITDTAPSATWQIPADGRPARNNRPLLELVGVIVGTGSDSAMIREKGGDAHTYRVGDQVGHRELVEIHTTHVILRNEGRLERLRIRGRSPQQQADPEELREFAERLISRPDEPEAPPPE